MLIFLVSPSYAEGKNAVGQQAQWLEQLNLTEYKNSVVYLDFWASWCGPCRKSFPWLNRMQEKYKDQGLVVIGINLDRDRKMAERFLTQVPAQFLLYSDTTGELGKTYQLQGMPSSYIFDGNGKLSEKHVGFKKSDTDEYENNIVKLLDQLKE
jgi:thiol-disulfide isomerase/thioredoxin